VRGEIWDGAIASMISRRRFLESAAWMSGAVATGVSSWLFQPGWANAAAGPIKVGIANS